MLSHRAAKNVALEDKPWHSAPGGKNRYHPVENPEGVVVFGMAEDELTHEELAAFVKNNVTFPQEIFTYGYSTAGGARFPRAMAGHINRHFRPHRPVDASEISTAGALTGIHEMMGFCIGDPNDSILTIPPVYGRFELDFGNTMRLEMVYADMGETDPFNDSQQIFEKLERALKKAAINNRVVRALLIVNPNNPLGRCYPVTTLRAMMVFCHVYALHFISDEVYAMSVFDSGEKGSVNFTSVLSIDNAGLIQADRVHVLYGMSKDFGSAGLRIGCLITRNAMLRKAMMANSRFHGTSGPFLAIATTILEDVDFVEDFLNTSRERLAENRSFTTSKLQEAGIEWHRGGNAGFFLYLDLSPWLPITDSSTNPEFALADKLLKGGVGLHPCEEHYQKKGWFRLVFSLKPEILDEGLRRLTNTLGPRPSQ